ncbi:MAG: multidrug effflux MFS transporter [Woeseiaceae bacterium]|nr:multidrug effflux MFS transporter [Woeseiaceae bacterium]
MELDQATKRRFVVVLGFLTAMGATAVDMSLAAIPDMASALGTSLASGQQIIGVFVLGLGLGQIPAGLMADRIGRMPVVYAGVVLFTIAGLATSFAPTIEIMLATRFVQGLGASVGIVMARAIVRDLATNEEAARLFSILAMIFTIAPVLAPIVGGFLVAHVGWRAPFVAVAAFGGIVLVLVATVLHETGQPFRNGNAGQQLAASVREFFSHRRSILGTALVVVAAMGFMTVISGASALIMEIYAYSAPQFGFIFATAGLTILAASIVNRRLLLRFNVLQMTGLGALIVGVAALQLLIIARLGHAPFWWVWSCTCLYLAGFSFLFANATAMALAPVPKVSGVSASLIGSLQNSLSAVSAIGAALIYDGSVACSVVLMGIFGTLVFVIFAGRNRILRGPLYLARG